MNENRTLRVALLGAGSVGSQVARLLLERAETYKARVGAHLELAGIGVRNVDAPRDVDLPKELLTSDIDALVDASDVVVELMGGIDPARELVLRALERGVDVVTANKALVAAHGPELRAAASASGAMLLYEAAVGGAIPIIRPLDASLAGDRVMRVMGIVNGTTNYILDKMHREGATLDEALRVATELGYAEADPTADIEGFDAASKATILASLAFHSEVPVASVHREGITGVTAENVAQAEKDDQVIKLLAICERVLADDGTESVNARVYPALVAKDHPLAAVHEAKNAIFVEAEAAGDLMFYGAGAGGVETASAVLGDLVSLARRRVAGGEALHPGVSAHLPVAPMSDVITRYQVTIDVKDQPGVMARVAGQFGEHGVSMESLEQRISDEGIATLVVGTHQARESLVQTVLEQLRQHEDVVEVRSFIRAEAV